MRRDFIVPISIFSMPFGVGSESLSGVQTGFHVVCWIFGFWLDFVVAFVPASVSVSVMTSSVVALICLVWGCCA